MLRALNRCCGDRRDVLIVAACFVLTTGLDCSISLAEPTGLARMDYGCRTAGAPSCPDAECTLEPARPSRIYEPLKSAEPSPIDPQKRYHLVELIDIAERANPETRVAWEAARQAAIGVGLVESEYFPVLTLSALGGYQSEAFLRPRMSLPVVSFGRTWSKLFLRSICAGCCSTLARRGTSWTRPKSVC